MVHSKDEELILLSQTLDDDSVNNYLKTHPKLTKDVINKLFFRLIEKDINDSEDWERVLHGVKWEIYFDYIEDIENGIEDDGVHHTVNDILDDIKNYILNQFFPIIKNIRDKNLKCKFNLKFNHKSFHVIVKGEKI